MKRGGSLLLALWAGMTAHAQAGPVEVYACRAYCRNRPLTLNGGQSLPETLGRLQSLCPESLRAQEGHWEYSTVHAGTNATVTRFSRSNYSITSRDVYSTAATWNPGPAASIQDNCFKQTIHPDRPQKQLGYEDLQG